MGKNLYIGNLPESVTSEDLKSNFSEVGPVLSANVIRDKYTGMSRGFGFVEMEKEEDAKEAIKRFDKGDLLGNTIKVNEAKPKPERSGGGGGGGRGGYGGGGGGGRRDSRWESGSIDLNLWFSGGEMFAP